MLCLDDKLFLPPITDPKVSNILFIQVASRLAHCQAQEILDIGTGTGESWPRHIRIYAQRSLLTV